MDIDTICIALQKSNTKFEDQIEFFENNFIELLYLFLHLLLIDHCRM